MLFFPLPRSLPPGDKGWLLTGELRVPAGEVRTTPARTISAEPGKQWAIDVPGASGDYPPFQVQATLLSIKPSAKEFRATFKLKGHHGNPHFGGFPCLEGGVRNHATTRTPEDGTAAARRLLLSALSRYFSAAGDEVHLTGRPNRHTPPPEHAHRAGRHRPGPSGRMTFRFFSWLPSCQTGTMMEA